MKEVFVELLRKWGRPGTGANVLAFFALVVVFPMLAGMEVRGFADLVTSEQYRWLVWAVLFVIAAVISKRNLNFKIHAGGLEVSAAGDEDDS